MIWWVIGVTSAIPVHPVVLVGTEARALEDFGRDLADRETDEVAESVRGQLDELRKGGAL